MDQLLEEMARWERTQAEGGRHARRGALWLVAVAATTTLGVLASSGGEEIGGLPYPTTWITLGALAALPGVQLCWRGLRARRRGAAELRRVDHELGVLTGATPP